VIHGVNHTLGPEFVLRRILGIRSEKRLAMAPARSKQKVGDIFAKPNRNYPAITYTRHADFALY
jgi:hypothetical protein